MHRNDALRTMAAMLLAGGLRMPAQPSHSVKILAQKVVEEVAAKHPEVTGLELAAARTAAGACKTIASTDPKDLGEKCDKDEFTALKSNQPFVEKEKDGYDVTIPLHDAAGAVLGTLGLDFKPEPGQQQDAVVRQARVIAAEIEKRIASRAQLFQAAK